MISEPSQSYNTNSVLIRAMDVGQLIINRYSSLEGGGKGGGGVRHKINGLCGLEPGKVKLFSIL